MVNPAAFPSSSASFPFDIPFPPSLPSTSSLACTTRMLLRSLSYGGGGGGGARGRDERRGRGELSRFSRGFHSLSIHPLPSPPLFSPYRANPSLLYAALPVQQQDVNQNTDDANLRQAGREDDDAKDFWRA